MSATRELAIIGSYGTLLISYSRAYLQGHWYSFVSRGSWIHGCNLRQPTIRFRGNSPQHNRRSSEVRERKNYPYIARYVARSKLLINYNFSVRIETRAEQFVLDRVRAVLNEHPFIEPGTSRIRVAGFAGAAFEMELWAYVKDMRLDTVHHHPPGRDSENCRDHRLYRYSASTSNQPELRPTVTHAFQAVNANSAGKLNVKNLLSVLSLLTVEKFRIRQ